MADNATTLSNRLTEIRGDQSQTIFIADLISEGPILGLVNDGASVYLDNVPLMDERDAGYSGTVTGYYQDRITFSNGNTGTVATAAGDPIDLSVLELRGPRIIILLLGDGNVNTYSITDISGSTVTVDGTVAAGTYAYHITPPALVDRGYSEVDLGVEKIRSGSFEFRSGTLTQPPLSKEKGVGNISYPAESFTTAELRQVSTSPYPTNGYTSNDFSADGTTIQIIGSSEFTQAQVKEIDELRFSITYPNLTATPTKGDRDNNSVTAIYQMTLEIFRDGIWLDPVDAFGTDVKHQANTSSPITFQHQLDLVQYQPFTDFRLNISRLTRHQGLDVLSDGSNGDTSGNEYRQETTSTLGGVFGVIRDLLSYPLSAYAGVTFSSEDFQSTPQRTYECRGLKVKVPSNYTTREEAGSDDPADLYDGFWDGSFRSELVYTDNPAWVFYDIVTNNRYGVGEWITADEIDKYALYRIARYCDELVSDGNGGLEPRFRANIYLTKATDVYKVLKDMATIFTGVLYWMDGKLTTILDSPADPVYNFTKGNVIEGAFSYESTGSKTRTNQVIVTWNNPENNYEATPLIVEDRNSILETGRIISQEAVAFGCTSEGQARRYGNWKLFTAQNQTEIVNFKTALAAGFLQPGDIINVSDADRFGKSFSGRVKTATTTSVTVDRELDLNGTSTYELSVLIQEPAAYLAQENSAVIGGQTYNRGDRIPGITTEEQASSLEDDSSNPVVVTWKKYTYTETRTAVAGSSANELEVSSAFSSAPAPSTIWALKEYSNGDETVNSAKMYRILAIRQEDKHIYSISAVEHFNEKYDAILDYDSVDIEDPVYPVREPTQVPEPQNVYILTTSNPKKPREELVLQWDSPADSSFITGYEIYHTVKGVPSPLTVGKDQFQYAFNNVENTLHIFRVRSLATSGNKSPWVSTSIRVSDPFTADVNRLAAGLAQGAVSTSSASIVESGGVYTYRFDDEEYALAPIQNPMQPIISESLYANSYTQEITDLIEVDTSNELLEFLTSSFILFDADDADHHLKLVAWDFLTFKNLYYWYDRGTGNGVPQFNNLTGTATLVANSNRLVGDNTAFTTELGVGNVVVLDQTNGFAAKVASVQNDELVILDRSFTTAFTNVTLKEPSLQIDFLNDCVISRVYKKSGSYYADNFLTIDPSLYDFGRAAIVDSNIAFINYEGDDANTQVTSYSNITIDVAALGYRKDAEFAVIWTDTNLSGTSDGTVASPNWQDGTNNTYTKVVHNSTDLPYDSGSPITFTIKVRSKADPNNVDKQITRTYSITKVRNGSIGKDGKTVRLNADDYSIIYDKNGLNPSYNGSSDNDVDLQAIPFNFTNPIYRFNGGAWSTSANFNLAIPSSFDDWVTKSEVVEVEVAENDGSGAPLNGVESTDSVSIFAVKTGADGLAAILSNDSHTLPSDTAGNVISNAGSGTSIEVIQGGTVLEYVASSPAIGQWTVTASPSGGVTAGTISKSGNFAIVGDHSFTGTDLNESVTYTITVPTSDGNVTLTRKQTFSKSRKGDNGADGVTGATGDPGISESGGVLYYNVLSTTDPGEPSDVVNGFGDLSPEREGWGFSAPQIDAGSTAKIWVCSYQKTYDPATNRTNITYTNSQQGLVLSGLVTFTSANPPLLADAETGSTTKIDGGAIEANTITATELKISNTTGGSSGIYMDADTNSIKIYDGSTLRVKLGNLS